MLNGPAGTRDVCRSVSLMYSSTVLGADDTPATSGIGCVMKPGVRPKLRASCTPPK